MALVDAPERARAAEGRHEAGHEGLALGRELVAALPPGSPETDELVGEVAIAINDLRQAAIAGRFSKDIGDLHKEVVANVKWPSRFRGPSA